MLKSRGRDAGFTLVELVIVMAVVAIILSAVIPNLRGMQQEAQLSKADGELMTLKSALTSWWRNNGQTNYPSNITTDLTSASPQLLTQVLEDPFHTDPVTNTYGYGAGIDPTFGPIFAVWTKGPKGDTAPNWDSANQRITFTGTGRVVSNAPVVKQ